MSKMKFKIKFTSFILQILTLTEEKIELVQAFPGLAPHFNQPIQHQVQNMRIRIVQKGTNKITLDVRMRWQL